MLKRRLFFSLLVAFAMAVIVMPATGVWALPAKLPTVGVLIVDTPGRTAP